MVELEIHGDKETITRFLAAAIFFCNKTELYEIFAEILVVATNVKYSQKVSGQKIVAKNLSGE